MKRTVAVILAALLPLMICGCNDKSEEYVMTEIGMQGMPDYSDDEENKAYTIGQWVNVPEQYSWLEDGMIVYGDMLTPEEFTEQYRFVKDSGINLAGVQLGCGTVNHANKLLAEAEKQGLRQLVHHSEFNAVIMDTSLSDSVAVTQARKLVESYKNHPCLAGHSIEDEPTYEELDMLEVAYRRYKAIFPDKLFYVNLFPAIADASVLGPDGFKGYVRRAVQAMPDSFISYDHYPLKGYAGNTSVVSDFLYHMEVMQDLKGDGQELWTFLQSGVSAGTRNPETYADIAWQAYSFMAFGGKGIQWFCYWEVPSEKFNGMINGKGERTNNYYIVQQVNREILGFDHIFLNYAWQGVMTTEGAADSDKYNANFEMLETSLIKVHNRISDISSEQDLLTGVFSENDNDGFMFVNFADPGKNLSSEVEVKFNDCAKVLVCRHGEVKAYRLSQGIFKTKLDAGEGIFVIPVA